MGYTQAAVLGVSLSLPLLGFLLVGVRFWMRRNLQKTYLGVDDWTILFASVVVIWLGVIHILGTYLGTMAMDGQPIIETRETMQKKLDYAILVSEKPAYGAIKLSVLFFYRRIFPFGNFRIINNWLIVIIIAWTLSFWFGDIFNCGVHPEANWDATVKAEVYCIDLFKMLLAFAITDVVTDIAILWLPYPQIKRLQMDLKERWAISGIFLLGTLDLIIGIVRMGFVIANEIIPAVNTHSNPPVSTAPTFWTVVEVGVGVIAANLPALAPLFKHRAKLTSSLSSFRERLLSRSGKSTSRNDSTAVVGTTQTSLSRIPPDGEVLVSNVEAGKEHRSESVGIWDQFEKAENQSDEEEGSRRTISQTIV